MNLLEVTDLRVSFPTSDGLVQAVRGVSFRVDRGQTLGIVGESGSGKTVCTQTLLGLTPGADVSGSAMFGDVNLITLSDDQMRHIRGAQIAAIFQDPLTSLHPLYRVGWQISEMIRAHDRSATKAQAHQRAVDLLTQVGIPQAAKRADDYPHQFSGGMRQRAMIAMALALNPKLIIADEPTTALDATVQAQILDLLVRLQREYETALIMITHDLGVIADLADDVMVMYAGRAAEYSDRRTLFYRSAPPVHQRPTRIHPWQHRSHGPAAADPRPAAEPHQRALRMRVPPALPVRHGPVHRRDALAHNAAERRWRAPVGVLASAQGDRPWGGRREDPPRGRDDEPNRTREGDR